MFLLNSRGWTWSSFKRPINLNARDGSGWAKQRGLKWSVIWSRSSVAVFRFAHSIQSVYNKDALMSSTESNASHKLQYGTLRLDQTRLGHQICLQYINISSVSSWISKTYMYLHTALMCVTTSFTFLPLFSSSPLIMSPLPLRLLYLIPPFPSISHKWICTHAIQSFQVLRVIRTSLPPLHV